MAMPNVPDLVIMDSSLVFDIVPVGSKRLYSIKDENTVRLLSKLNLVLEIAIIHILFPDEEDVSLQIDLLDSASNHILVGEAIMYSFEQKAVSPVDEVIKDLRTAGCTIEIFKIFFKNSKNLNDDLQKILDQIESNVLSSSSSSSPVRSGKFKVPPLKLPQKVPLDFFDTKFDGNASQPEPLTSDDIDSFRSKFGSGPINSYGSILTQMPPESRSACCLDDNERSVMQQPGVSSSSSHRSGSEFNSDDVDNDPDLQVVIQSSLEIVLSETKNANKLL